MVLGAFLLLSLGCGQNDESVASDPGKMMLASSPLTGLDAELLDDMEAAILADSFPNTTSVLLVHNDALVYENYFGSGDKNLLNDTRSTMKSLTALAVGIAIDEGQLSLDQPVFDLFKDLEPFQHDTDLKRQITIEDFLTMSSALDCNDNDMESPGNEENMYPLNHWARWAVDLPTKESYQRNEEGRGPFSYCTAGSFMLGQALERATGKTVDAYIAEKIFQPLHITDWQWSRSPTGEYMTGGGLRLEAADIAKLGTTVLNKGKWGSRQILSPSWIDEMASVKVNANPDQNYGYQFWRRGWQTSCGVVDASYMAGNGGNAVVILPELGAVVVVTRQHYNRRGQHQQTIRLIEDFVLKSLPCE